MQMKTIRNFIILFVLLMSAAFVIIKSDYTFQVVDQIYCRGNLPWAAEQKVDRCIYRSGDDLFENDFIESELQYLADNPYQNSYSERIMNGYPITDAYSGNKYSLFHLLSAYTPTTTSIVFSSLIILFISFTLGFTIARSLAYDNKYSILFGLLTLTPAYVSLFESWNLALLGYGFLILGMIQFYKHAKASLFTLFSFIGGSLIVLSSIYQFYLYAVINVGFLAFIYFFETKIKQKKKGLIVFAVAIIAFVSSLLVWNFHVSDHLQYLQSSNKVGGSVNLNSLIRRKGFAFDPLGWMGSELVIVHRSVLNKILPSQIFTKIQAFQSGYDSPGVAYVLLLFLGLVYLWKKQGINRLYVGVILFWFFYFTGSLQWLLSATIGDPFLSETSIRGSYFFFLFGVYAVVYALRGLINGSIKLTKVSRIIFVLVSAYVMLVALIMTGTILVRGFNFSEPPFMALAGLAFLLGIYFLQKNKKNQAQVLLFVAVLLPTLARLFFGATPAVFNLNPTKLYFPETTFSTELDKYPEITRVAMFQTVGSPLIHSNTAIRMGLASANAYRNPTDRNFLEFSKYFQFTQTNPKSALESFNNFKSSFEYTRNGFEPITLEDSLFEINSATKRYLDLLGVNGLITSSNVQIKDTDWERVVKENELSLWRKLDQTPSFFFATNTVEILDEKERLSYIFENDSFDPNKIVVCGALQEPTGVASGIDTNEIELIESTDGYRKFNVNTKYRGILSIPATFHKNWQARWKSEEGGAQIALQTVRANYAFLGVVVPSYGVGEIELIYNDKVQKWEYYIIILGLLLIISLTFWLNRGKITKR
jgi:hypothetical protein